MNITRFMESHLDENKLFYKIMLVGLRNMNGRFFLEKL